MTAIYQAIASPAPPAASAPAIDFAIVLARTIAEADKDPAQLHPTTVALMPRWEHPERGCGRRAEERDVVVVTAEVHQ
jgi:hypothetical protein